LQRDLQRGDLQGLAADLTDLQGLMPQGSPLVSRWEGVLALEQGRLKRAQDCFRRVLAEIPDDFSAQVNLALALVRDGKDQQARRLVDKLLEIRPESKLVKGLSRRLDRLGRP
jgi:Flp pilus assembly protein TadD